MNTSLERPLWHRISGIILNHLPVQGKEKPLESKRFQGSLRFVVPESFRWLCSLLLTADGSCRLGNSSERLSENNPSLFPLDGVGSAVPSLQLHPVFGIDTERVPPNDAMSRFVGFGDKSWDNLKNFFQTQGFEFLFLSQSARRVAFGGSMAPKTPVLKLNRPFARKPPAAIASELTRVACAPFAKPQVAGLRHS